MGNKLLSGYTLSSDFESNKQCLWHVHRGTKKGDKSGIEFSIFVYDRKFSSGESESKQTRIATMLLRDAQMLQRLKHPSIVPLVEPVLDEKGVMVFVTKPVRCTLSTYARSLMLGSSMSEGTRASLLSGMCDIASALEFLHGDCHVVHMGLSPNVIFVMDSHKWVLGGFGSCLPIDSKCEWFSLHPMGHANTPFDGSAHDSVPPLAVCAPELVSTYNSKQPWSVSPSADIFALGLIMYQLFYPGGATRSLIDEQPIAAGCETSSVARSSGISIEQYMSAIRRNLPLSKTKGVLGLGGLGPSTSIGGQKSGDSSSVFVSSILVPTLDAMLQVDPRSRVGLHSVVSSQLLSMPSVRLLRFLENLDQKTVSEQETFLNGFLRALQTDENCKSLLESRGSGNGGGSFSARGGSSSGAGSSSGSSSGSGYASTELLTSRIIPSLFSKGLVVKSCWSSTLEGICFCLKQVQPKSACAAALADGFQYISPILTGRDVTVAAVVTLLNNFRFMIDTLSDKSDVSAISSASSKTDSADSKSSTASPVLSRSECISQLHDFATRCFEIPNEQILVAAVDLLDYVIDKIEYTSFRSVLCPKLLDLALSADSTPARIPLKFKVISSMKKVLKSMLTKDDLVKTVVPRILAFLKRASHERDSGNDREALVNDIFSLLSSVTEALGPAATVEHLIPAICPFLVSGSDIDIYKRLFEIASGGLSRNNRERMDFLEANQGRTSQVNTMFSSGSASGSRELSGFGPIPTRSTDAKPVIGTGISASTGGGLWFEKGSSASQSAPETLMSASAVSSGLYGAGSGFNSAPQVSPLAPQHHPSSLVPISWGNSFAPSTSAFNPSGGVGTTPLGFNSGLNSGVSNPNSGNSFLGNMPSTLAPLSGVPSSSMGQGSSFSATKQADPFAGLGLNLNPGRK